MNVTDISSSDWQMSTTYPGDIAQGADDINQSFNIILTTQQGSDPLRFDFGIDLLSLIDTPADVMAPNLVQQIISQCALYETRVDLKTVNYSTATTGGVVFALTWVYKPGVVVNGKATADTDNGLTTYFLLADQNGFVLLSGYDVGIIVN
jgi:phage baseplate assembly protein W